MSENTQAATGPELTVTPPAPELTVVDLQNLRQVVDVAARRGAFAGAELSSVGAVYTKLDTFLNAVAPPQPATDGSAPATAAQ